MNKLEIEELCNILYASINSSFQPAVAKDPVLRIASIKVASKQKKSAIHEIEKSMDDDWWCTGPTRQKAAAGGQLEPALLV
jgi:hypothetical protein